LLIMLLFRFRVFFFQAEDGIRDFHVTGVQTCALPICSSNNSTSLFCSNSFANSIRMRHPPENVSVFLTKSVGLKPNPMRTFSARSEERRVGKECRSRWWPDQ